MNVKSGGRVKVGWWGGGGGGGGGVFPTPFSYQLIQSALAI